MSDSYNRQTNRRWVSVLGSLWCAAGLGAAWPAPRAAAQEPEATAAFAGTVYSLDTGEALPDAQVVLRSAGIGALTDSLGRFSIEPVPAHSDSVEVRFLGFFPRTVLIPFEPRKRTRVIFYMNRTVLQLAEIKVEVSAPRLGKLTGFEERRAKGVGFFITREQIDHRNPIRTTEMLRMVPGVTVLPMRLGRAPVEMGRGAYRCPPFVYVDGRPKHGLQVDDVPPREIDGIEIYRGPSEIPSRYPNVNGKCGVVIIWTRSGRQSR